MLGRVLRAQVVLRGLVIEWVKVKAFNEDFHTVDGKVSLVLQYIFNFLCSPVIFLAIAVYLLYRLNYMRGNVFQVDLWSKSKYAVFQKVNLLKYIFYAAFVCNLLKNLMTLH